MCILGRATFHSELQMNSALPFCIIPSDILTFMNNEAQKINITHFGYFQHISLCLKSNLNEARKVHAQVTFAGEQRQCEQIL